MRRRAPRSSTPRPLGSSSSRRIASGCASSYLLLEQASFWDHDDVAGVQGDIPLKVLSGLVGPVVEHENVLTRPTTTPDHDAPLGRAGTEAPRKRNRLHQCCFLAHDVRARPQNLPGDENF